MPYRVRGSDVLVQKGGKWVVKYHHDSHKDALKQLAALQIHDPHAGGKKKRKK